MTPAEELTAVAQTLRDAAFRGALTATPAVAALLRARHAIVDWLDAEATRITATAHPTRHETLAPHALAIARHIIATTGWTETPAPAPALTAVPDPDPTRVVLPEITGVHAVRHTPDGIPLTACNVSIYTPRRFAVPDDTEVTCWRCHEALREEASQ